MVSGVLWKAARPGEEDHLASEVREDFLGLASSHIDYYACYCRIVKTEPQYDAESSYNPEFGHVSDETPYFGAAI
jgi:hypothetical protein